MYVKVILATEKDIQLYLDGVRIALSHIIFVWEGKWIKSPWVSEHFLVESTGG